jgi:hypothetical protein
VWKINHFRTFCPDPPNFAEHFLFLSIASLVITSLPKASEVAQRIHPILLFFCGRADLELGTAFAHSRKHSIVEMWVTPCFYLGIGDLGAMLF